ncbi:MAG: 4Fe-4S dicluster domain-containing protein [Candidatus Methanoperedens sp.]|nr:4Fe-4S dicluster domain-containing protein [Candidatus Methanoperedens sp.]
MVERGFITVIGCNKCGKCDNVCPKRAIERIDGITRISHEKCDLCMGCVEIFPNKALKLLE